MTTLLDRFLYWVRNGSSRYVDQGPWLPGPPGDQPYRCAMRSTSTDNRCVYYNGHGWPHDQPFQGGG